MYVFNMYIFSNKSYVFSIRFHGLVTVSRVFDFFQLLSRFQVCFFCFCFGIFMGWGLFRGLGTFSWIGDRFKCNGLFHEFGIV